MRTNVKDFHCIPLRQKNSLETEVRIPDCELTFCFQRPFFWLISYSPKWFGKFKDPND